MLSFALTALLPLPQEPIELSRSERAVPELGVTVTERRLLDPSTGRIDRVATDATGRALDPVELRRRAIERRDTELGKLHPTLAAQLAGGGQHEVAFWLRPAGQMPDLRGAIDAAMAAGEGAEAARRQALALAGAAVAPGNAAFAAAARAAGAAVVHVDTITPVVFVRANADRLRALAQRGDVDLAYASSPQWQDEGANLAPELLVPLVNEWASKTARTDVVHRRGITGQGVKVMVNDTSGVAPNNPFLPPLVVGGGPSVASHATAVAGILASDQVPHTGAAPGLTELYSYGGSGDIVAPMAWAWGMSQGISFGNCSWWNGQKGQIQFLDRYFDYIIRHFAVLLFKSSGNQGGSDAKVTTPGNGFNSVASGNSSDQNNHDWSDDVMSSSSSWVDPIEGHRKPEVTACGSSITTTTTASPWIGGAGSGTSYSSPVTCGIAALLAQQDPLLQARPEAVRALLMAGAFHNVEGAAAYSDRDGAGHVDAAASHAALVAGQLHTGTLTPASFVGGEYAITIPLVANDETRIGACWMSLANSSYSTDVLQMDLDLTVWSGSTLVASSASQFDSFELVQFVPPVTGNYTVRLHNQQFLGSSEPFALAWVNRRNAATNEVVVGGSATLGGTVTFEFADTYHPGQGYAAILSVTPFPATLPVGPGKVLACGGDGLTGLSLQIPGFVGNLGANGRANASLGIPDLTVLSGLQVYCAMVTLDPSPVVLSEETSPVVTFTIQ